MGFAPHIAQYQCMVRDAPWRSCWDVLFWRPHSQKRKFFSNSSSLFDSNHAERPENIIFQGNLGLPHYQRDVRAFLNENLPVNMDWKRWINSLVISMIIFYPFWNISCVTMWRESEQDTCEKYNIAIRRITYAVRSINAEVLENVHKYIKISINNVIAQNLGIMSMFSLSTKL